MLSPKNITWYSNFKVCLLIKIYNEVGQTFLSDQRWFTSKNSYWKEIYRLFIIHLQTVNRSKNLGFLKKKGSKTMTSIYLIQLWNFWNSNANSQDSKVFFSNMSFIHWKKRIILVKENVMYKENPEDGAII
jgi:hypothetical protein